MGAVPLVNLAQRRRSRQLESGLAPLKEVAASYVDPVITIGPQAGPQTDFLTTPADIAVYGGAAGGGKSYALLLEPLRHFDNPKFSGIIFRRTAVQVRNPGGLWDESTLLYAALGAQPRETPLTWSFPSGMDVKFSHLENDKSVLDWQGSQIPYIAFDELTHFTEKMFFYMLSRNRSASGVPGYVRATCNPDADSWVRKLVDWYIGTDGYPIRERAGVLRWFIRVEDAIKWADSVDELELTYGREQVYTDDGTCIAKSFTFIPSNVHDNKILLQKDPAYLANLRSLPRVERLRLLGGNWDIRATAGTMFRREWFPALRAVPHGWDRCLRYWDRAATKPSTSDDGTVTISAGKKVSRKDPDWTRGVKIYSYPNGTFLIGDVKSIRDTPGQVEKFIKAVASHDGPGVEIMSQCDPGSAGKSEAENFIRMLRGYVVSTETLSQNKVTRSKAYSAQAEAGNVYILVGEWNEEFLSEHENFPDGKHDDQVDGASGGFNKLCGVNTFTKVV